MKKTQNEIKSDSVGNSVKDYFWLKKRRYVLYEEENRFNFLLLQPLLKYLWQVFEKSIPFFILFRYYNLVPIAAEDYSGYESKTYYSVAVARRTDAHLTIFNLKGNNMPRDIFHYKVLEQYYTPNPLETCDCCFRICKKSWRTYLMIYVMLYDL